MLSEDEIGGSVGIEDQGSDGDERSSVAWDFVVDEVCCDVGSEGGGGFVHDVEGELLVGGSWLRRLRTKKVCEEFLDVRDFDLLIHWVVGVEEEGRVGSGGGDGREGGRQVSGEEGGSGRTVCSSEAG